MPDTDFSPALVEAAKDRTNAAEAATLLRGALTQWLPGIGNCVNVTFTVAQKDALLKVLRM